MKIVSSQMTAGVSTALALLLSQGALAAPGTVTLKNEDQAASAAALTDRDYANAVPIEMIASPGEVREVPALADQPSKKVGKPASLPTVKVAADPSARLFDESLAPSAAKQDAMPVDRGTSGANYTLSSMIPNTQANALTYPHLTTGKLYFSVPGGTAYCTAAVINRRVLATAGHCVSDGQGHFYSNWRFVPATFSGSSPLQVWNWRYVVTTTTWFNGGGGVPNAADYAMIELEDRSFSGTVRRIGDVTGWLGWQTLSCSNNHLHILGYPGNVFSGVRLSLASAQTWRNVAPFNCEYGTSQTFGASGGPWVQNFAPANPIPQNNSGLLRVVTVASYTYGQAFGVLGGSNLDNRWVSVWNSVCGHRVGNCS